MKRAFLEERQPDRQSEQGKKRRPLRRCVAQVLNKATCQTAVCNEKTLRSPKPDCTHNIHTQNMYAHTQAFSVFFFKTRLDIVERQAFCISPKKQQPDIKKTSEGTADTLM